MVRAFLTTLLMACTLLVPGSVSAQELPVSVSWMDGGADDPHRSVQSEVGEAFRQEATQRGLTGEGPGVDLVIRAESRELTDGTYIQVSVVEGTKMPDALVDTGTRHQLYYSGTSRPDREVRGPSVKESAARNYFDAFVSIRNLSQMLVPQDSLHTEISAYFDGLTRRMADMRPW